MATTTRTRSTGTSKRTPRRRSAASTAKSQSLTTSTRRRVTSATKQAGKAVSNLQGRASDAIGSIPVNRTTMSVAIGALAVAALAGIGAMLGRERLMQAATAGRDKLRQTADDLSTAAHEKIDQARDNIHKLRTRNSSDSASTDTSKRDLPMAM